jgi:hypothetical protein
VDAGEGRHFEDPGAQRWPGESLGVPPPPHMGHFDRARQQASSRPARLPPPIQGSGVDGEPWFLVPVGEPETALKILKQWAAQSLVYRDTNDPVELSTHESTVLDIRKVGEFSQKIVLGSRCYFALCRRSQTPDALSANLIVSAELCEYNGATVIKPYTAAFKPVVHKEQTGATEVATQMFVGWLSVLLRTLNARLDLSLFESHSVRTEWLRAQLEVESGIHGYADVGERTNWSFAPQDPQNPRMADILDEWASQSLVYQQSTTSSVKSAHTTAIEDIQRVRDFSQKEVRGRQLYFSLASRDSAPDAQSVSALVSAEQIDDMRDFHIVLHSLAFKPALLNNPKEFADAYHLLVTSLFSLLNTLGAKLDLGPLETSKELQDVRESLSCGVAVMQAVGLSKPQRWIAPPSVQCDEGEWHLVPKSDDDEFVKQILEEWKGMSQVYHQAADSHSSMHADALDTIEKVQSFCTSDRVYYFLCKDSEVPTAESVCLMLTGDLDDSLEFRMRMQNLVFKPTLLNDPQESIATSTKLVLCLIELMTKFGVNLDLSLFETRDVCSRVVHDKLVHFTN